MISLTAMQMGKAVDLGRLDGRVHSVFERACNLEMAHGGFVTLITRDVAMAPRAIRLATPAGFRFDELLKPGLRFACRGGKLRFLATEFEVDIRAAEKADCTLPRVSDFGFDDEMRVRWHMAWCALDVAETLRRIGRALPVGLLHAADRRLAAASLIGVGPGLTPAGDDILVGLAAGFGVTGQDFSDIRLVIDAQAARTTDLSAAMLRDAADGLFSDPVIDLAAAVRRGGDVRDVLARLIAIGDTSGAAAALGVLLGIASADPILRGALRGLDKAA